jgi:hypothetical protein
MTAKGTLCLLAFALCAIFIKTTTAISADTTDANPDDVFQADGLVREGNWLLLRAEGNLHKRVWSLQQSDEAVRSATSTHRSLMPTVTRGIETLHVLAEKSDEVDKLLDSLRDKKDDESIDTYNNRLTDLDRLRAQIITEQEALNGLLEREGQVEEARARFIGGVMDTQAGAGEIARTYSALAKDAVLKGAISRANAGAESPLTLGPSVQFTNDQEFLDDAAQKVVSASVPVQKTNMVGGLHVEPIINGKMKVSMTWDSGCTLTQLSSTAAAALGVKLTDQNQSTESIIAGGAKIKGKLAVLDSVQLGPFTLHGVLCEVIEGDAGSSVPDLLGNSFQGHFLSRLDQQSGRLQLTPIDSSVEIGAIGEPRSNTAARIAVVQNPPSVRPKDFDLARLSTATASSTLDGCSPHGAIDGIVAGAPDSPRREWASDQPTGSITLTWDQPVSVSSAKLWDRVNGTDHIVSGQMVFEDGSTVPFGELPAGGNPLALNFAPRTVRWIRFEILTVGAGTQNPGFAEICLFQ